MFGDWHQLWEIISAPDNVPIVALVFLVPFFTWYALRQAKKNDELIASLAADPAAAKSKYRKTQPWHPKWEREVHTWPYLMRIEFLVAIIVTVLLMVWSLTLNAPLEEPSNPNVTMNPAKAPWYFLGLQEMLVYFDPWIAGVVMPTLIIVGLMAVPFIDTNPLGNGYYTFKQRRFAIWTFLVGFIGLWVAMICIGTFIRGPGWMWFWPTQTWDAEAVQFTVNRNLDQVFPFSLLHINGSIVGHLPGVSATYAPVLAHMIFGIFPVVIFFIVAAWLFHKLCMTTEFSRKIYKRMSLIQIATMYIFLSIMLALPIKILLRLLFDIKYVWVTPWFSI
ncbi:MAG: cytochrome C [Candidatus Acidiferrales bacterium]